MSSSCYFKFHFGQSIVSDGTSILVFSVLMFCLNTGIPRGWPRGRGGRGRGRGR